MKLYKVTFSGRRHIGNTSLRSVFYAIASLAGVTEQRQR